MANLLKSTGLMYLLKWYDREQINTESDPASVLGLTVLYKP